MLNKIKNILIKTPYNYLQSLNIWEKILLFLLFIGLIITTNFIFVGSISFFNSDTAIANLLAKEQIFSKQLFPTEWIYVQDVWTFFINVPMIFLSLFIKDQVLLRCTAVFIQTLILLLMLIVYNKYIFKNNSILLYGTIIFTLFTLNNLENMFAQAAYGYQVIFILIIFIFTTISVSDDFKINKKLIIFSCLSLCIACISGVRLLGTVVIPIICSFTLVYIIENINETYKKVLDDLKKYILWLLLLFSSALIGYFIYCIIKTSSYFVAGVSEQIIRSHADINNIIESIKIFISGLWLLFGIEYRVNLFSINGIAYILRYFATFAFMFVFPILLLKKYKNENIHIKRLILFSWISFIITIIIYILSINIAVDVITIRYFQIPMIMQIILSSYFIYKYLLKKNFLTCLTCMLILIIYICTNIYIGINMEFNKSSKNIIKERNELKIFFKEKDLKFGYASYWNAYKNSTLFNFEPEIAAILPYKFPIEKYPHLTTNRYYNPNYYNGRTFLLLTEEEFQIFNNKKNEYLYGKPEEKYQINGYIILIYKYNLSNLFSDFAIAKGIERDVLIQTFYNEYTVFNDDKTITLNMDGIVFGPYWTLDKGIYKIKINCDISKNIEDYLSIKVHTDLGKTNIPVSETKIYSGENIIEFRIHELTNNFEIVIINNNFDEVLLREITLLKLE